MYLSCLWPDKEAIESSGEASDTNSHSIVLSLRYLEFDLVLTGDLEGMGEEEVTKEIEEGKPQKRIPIYYTHKETLKRLIDSGCRILQTLESGAVTVITDGKNMRINEWSKGG